MTEHLIPKPEPDDELDVIVKRRAQIKSWLANVLWHYEDSGALGDEAADIIMATLETCLPVSAKTLSCPLPDPSELVRTLESHWG